MGNFQGLMRFGLAIVAGAAAALAAGSMIVAAAQTNQPALQGASGGDLKTFAIPAKGRLTGILLYTGDAGIDGIAFEYRADADFGNTATTTPVFGTFRGKSEKRLQILRGVSLKQADITFGSQLSSVRVEWTGQSNPPETIGSAGPQKGVFTFPADNNIVGVRVRADASHIYAIAFDTSLRTDLPVPGQTIAAFTPGKPADPADAAPVFAGAEFPYAGAWQVADEMPQLVKTGDIAKDGPNCITCTTWKTPAVIRIMPLDPSGRQLRIRFDSAPGQEVIITKVDDTTWQQIGGGATARFMKSGGQDRVRIMTQVAPQGVLYERPQLVQAAKEEADDPIPVGQEDKVSKDSLYTTNNVVGAYMYALSGYDGLKMNVMSFNDGVGFPIFRDPKPTEYQISRYLSDPKAVPNGMFARSLDSGAGSTTNMTIGSESSAYKSMGYNVGVEGGADGASVGMAYSHDQKHGLSMSNNQMMAMSVTRIRTYALILDKPNLKLTSHFRGWVEDVLMRPPSPPGKKKADASFSEVDKYAWPEDFDRFVEIFGTHYANAITYGGIAVAHKTYSAEEFGTWNEKNDSVSGSAAYGAGSTTQDQGGGKSTTSGTQGVALKGGYTESSGSSYGSQISFAKDDWQTVGGTGGMSENNWNVPLQSSAPMGYDLRPISQLVSGLWFDAPDGSLVYLQNQINAAIKRRMAKMPKLDTTSSTPLMYRLEFQNLYCTDKGDDATNNIELYGKAYALWSDDHSPNGGVGEVQLIDSPDDNFDMVCDGKTPYALNKKAVAWTKPTDMAGKLEMSISMGQLTEDDNSVTDLDDKMNAQGGTRDPSFYFGDAAIEPKWTTKYYTEKGPPGAPTLKLEMRIQRILPPG